MAKKEVRMMVASSDVAPLIDRGLDVDISIKNLTTEDKGIKARLGEVTSGSIQDGETSIRLKGNIASAVVSVVEKYELNASSEFFATVRKAVDAGILADVIEKSQQLAVPQADIEKAAEILKKAGINAMVAEGFSVNAESFRNLKANTVLSGEQSKARNALEACVSKSVSYRVKYEKG